MFYDIFYGVDYVADIVIGDVRACGEADADFEEGFADAIDIGWGVAVDGLLMHRLPQRTGLDIGVWLTVGCGCPGSVGHSGSSTNGIGDHPAVGCILPRDAQVWIDCGRAEP